MTGEDEVTGYCTNCRMYRDTNPAKPYCPWCEWELHYDSDPTEDPKHVSDER